VTASALEHQPCTAILDDAAARAAARTLGVRSLGTIGILVRAKLQNLTTSAEQTILEVRRAGLSVDDKLVTEVLREIGED